MKIGEVIARKRREKNLTQEQLAEKLGVTTSAVSKWETGATCPDITLLAPTARALGATVDELLCFGSEPENAEIEAYTAKARAVYEAQGFDAGWAYCLGCGAACPLVPSVRRGEPVGKKPQAKFGSAHF